MPSDNQVVTSCDGNDTLRCQVSVTCVWNTAASPIPSSCSSACVALEPPNLGPAVAPNKPTASFEVTLEPGSMLCTASGTPAQRGSRCFNELYDAQYALVTQMDNECAAQTTETEVEVSCCVPNSYGGVGYGG